MKSSDALQALQNWKNSGSVILVWWGVGNERDPERTTFGFNARIADVFSNEGSITELQIAGLEGLSAYFATSTAESSLGSDGRSVRFEFPTSKAVLTMVLAGESR